MNKPTFYITLLSVVALGSTASAVVLDFSSAAQYDTTVSGNFNEVVGTSGVDKISYSSTAGVGGVSGRLDIAPSGTSGDTTALFKNETFNLSNSNAYTVSIFFLTASSFGTGTTAGLAMAQVGFSESTTQGFLSTGGQDYISARVNTAATANQFTLLTTIANNGTALSANSSAAFTLATSTYYQLTATFTRNVVAGKFDFSSSLFDRGTAGTSTATLVSSIAGVGVNGLDVDVLETSTAAIAGFRTGNSSTGPTNRAVALDNFSAVPEPSTYASILIGFGLLIGSRRFLNRRSA